jgi:predicted amidohydrolase
MTGSSRIAHSLRIAHCALPIEYYDIRMSDTLRVALGEYDTGWHDPETSLSRAEALIRDVRARGANLVVLPEMCNTGFTMDAPRYSETLDGPSIRRFAHMAREYSVHIVAGLATRSGGREQQFHNSSIVIGPDGLLLAEYRKQRLFAYALEHETYTAGNAPVIVEIHGVQLALLVCFDLRFPELFRDVAAEVDGFVVIASWPSARQSHWETLLRARAIENQAFVVGVNRSGRGGELEYQGGSVVYGPWGEALATGAGAIAELKRGDITAARTKFPLIEDRRPCAMLHVPGAM